MDVTLFWNILKCLETMFATSYNIYVESISRLIEEAIFTVNSGFFHICWFICGFRLV